MTKEEVASIVKYCNDNGVSYKARLSELGVTGRGFSKKNTQAPKMISVELRTPTGTMMRIQGELDKECLLSIIQADASGPRPALRTTPPSPLSYRRR